MNKYQDFQFVISELEKMDIDPKALYTHLGLSRQSWSGYKTSGKIPLEHAVNIEYWLSSKINKLIESHVTPSDSSNIINIKLYDMQLSAGVGTDLESINELPTTQIRVDKSILPRGVSTDNIVAMQVDGKSMIPTILPSEIVLYKEDIGRYSGDSLYVVNFGGMLMVKRIQFNPELTKFDIISDNPSFKSYSVELSEENQNSFIIIGKVIATIQQ